MKAPVDAEGDDLCCSRECVKTVCDRMDAEIAAWREQELRELEASLVEGPCRGPGCTNVVKTLLPNHQTGCAFCSKECERKRVAEMWGEEETDMDIPY